MRKKKIVFTQELKPLDYCKRANLKNDNENYLLILSSEWCRKQTKPWILVQFDVVFGLESGDNQIFMIELKFLREKTRSLEIQLFQEIVSLVFRKKPDSL